MLKPASLFSQLLSEIFTAVNFDNLIAKWGAERPAKGFRSKTQLVSMLFCVRPYGAIEIPALPLDLTQTHGTKNRKLTEEEKETNRLLSKARSRGEHIFLIAKRIFGFSKVRYRGLAKNTNFAFVLFALSNLYMVRRGLLALTGA